MPFIYFYILFTPWEESGLFTPGRKINLVSFGERVNGNPWISGMDKDIMGGVGDDI